MTSQNEIDRSTLFFEHQGALAMIEALIGQIKALTVERDELKEKLNQSIATWMQSKYEFGNDIKRIADERDAAVQALEFIKNEGTKILTNPKYSSQLGKAAWDNVLSKIRDEQVK